MVPKWHMAIWGPRMPMGGQKVAIGQSRANIDFLTEYEYLHKVEFPIFVFEYPVFGDNFSNIRIYSDIRPLQKTIFDRI